MKTESLIAVFLVAGFLLLLAVTAWVFLSVIPACVKMLQAPDFDERNAHPASESVDLAAGGE